MVATAWLRTIPKARQESDIPSVALFKYSQRAVDINGCSFCLWWTNRDSSLQETGCQHPRAFKSRDGLVEVPKWISTTAMLRFSSHGLVAGVICLSTTPWNLIQG